MAELVAVDDFLSKILWCKNFLVDQGIPLETHLYQDNQSSILMCKKGQDVLGKRTRAMNIRYFAIKDNVDKGYLKVIHLGTNEMLGDFFTKPLQGKKFMEFRDLILSRTPVETSAGKIGAQ